NRQRGCTSVRSEVTKRASPSRLDVCAQVDYGILELVQEAVVYNVDLVEVDGLEVPDSASADIPHLERRVFCDLSLNAEGPGLAVGHLQMRVEDERGIGDGALERIDRRLWKGGRTEQVSVPQQEGQLTVAG